MDIEGDGGGGVVEDVVDGRDGSRAAGIGSGDSGLRGARKGGSHVVNTRSEVSARWLLEVPTRIFKLVFAQTDWSRRQLKTSHRAVSGTRNTRVNRVMSCI